MNPAKRLDRKAIFASVLGPVALWSLAACAHVKSGQAGGFLSGLSHPVSGLDHLVAMIAVVPLQAFWARITVRVAGSWVVGVGMLMLGWLAQRAA